MMKLRHGICGEDIRWLIFDCSIVDQIVHDRFNLLDLHRSRSIRSNSFVPSTERRVLQNKISLSVCLFVCLCVCL